MFWFQTIRDFVEVSC